MNKVITITDIIFCKAWEERILSHRPEQNPFSTIPVKIFVASMIEISKSEVADLVRNAGWFSELLLECTQKFPDDFKKFYETDPNVVDNTINDMTYVFNELQTQTATLQEFLEYDVLRKEEAYDGVCIPTSFWSAQNIIQSMFKVVPDIAKKILSDARDQHLWYQEEKQIIETSKEGIVVLFKNFKSPRGKVRLLNDKLWCVIKTDLTNGINVDYTPLNGYRREILEMIEFAAKNNDGDMVSEIGNMVMALSGKNSDNFMKIKSLELLEPYKKTCKRAATLCTMLESF